MVERSPEKAGVGGSTPSLATTFQGTYPQQTAMAGYFKEFRELRITVNNVFVSADLSLRIF